MKCMLPKGMLLILLLGLGCLEPPAEPEYENPYDASGDKYIAPAITDLDPSDGDIVHSRNATFSWGGTSVVKEYGYSLDGGEISKQTGTSVTLYDLEEGTHTFFVKAFTPYRSSEGKTIHFSVDAVPSPGIIFSPRRVSGTSDVTLILEEVVNLMGAHIEILCTGNCATLSAFTLAVGDEQFAAYSRTEEGSRLIIDLAYLSGSNGLSGTRTLGHFVVTPTEAGEISIDSETTVFRDADNRDIPIQGLDRVRVE